MIQSKFLQYSISIIFILFGTLKLWTGHSPAESICIETIQFMTLEYLSESTCVTLLAFLEIGIGLLLFINSIRKVVIVIALGHLACTFLPLFIFPDLAFNGSLVKPTLLTQYILKNIVLITALITLLPPSFFHESLNFRIKRS